jgi:hypothetical protein
VVSGPRYRFDEPVALVFDGHHIWAANYGGNSLTELDVRDGRFLRTVSGASYGFFAPSALAFDGRHIWAAN